jgi:PAS domain S-box-containing protein
MTLSTRPGKLSRIAFLLRQAGIYALAISLPWTGTFLSVERHALDSTPLALSFAAIAVLTLTFGFWPGMVAGFVAALSFNYYVLGTPYSFAYRPGDLIHTVAIVCVASLVIYLCHRQRLTSERLRLALASVHSRTEALMEAQQGSNSVTWTLAIGDREIHWAEGGAEIFGRPFAEIHAPTLPAELVFEEDRSAFREALNFALDAAEPFQHEFRVVWPSGDVRWLEMRGTPSQTDASLWRGVIIDVTERKRAEVALIRSEKLAAVGRLSATVAHEINNPLEAVTNLLYLATLDPSLTPQTRGFLEQADEQLARLASIARHTLTYVRAKPSDKPTRLAEVIESVVAMFEPVCRSRGVALGFVPGADTAIRIPTDELRQILTNIVSNACAAVPDLGGKIEIESLLEDGWAVLEIRDNGGGIPQENLARIFDPFFTTKPEVGTGIGLWVTRELAEKNRGLVAVRSGELPGGFRTVFRASFPVVASSIEGQPTGVAHV